MAAGAEHLKERVSEYVVSKRAKAKGEAFTGTLSGNWNEERFDSRLVSTGGKRAALPTELDHTWQSSYATMNCSREAAGGAAHGPSKRQLSSTTTELLDTLSGKNSAAQRLSQSRLIDVVDGRHRAFPGHQPEQDLPGKDGQLPSDIPPSTVVRDSYIAPVEHRRRQQVNAADTYYGPAHDKARFVLFKLQQALQNRNVAAKATSAKKDAAAAHVRTNFSFPALRKALFEAERKPPVPGVSKTDGRITMQELGEGLARYGVPLEEAELVCIFKHLDKGGNGEVGVIDAVKAIRGSMNDRRRGVVARAFHLLESTVGARNKIPHGQPVGVTFGDVLHFFDAAAHPDVEAGVCSADTTAKQLFEEYYADGSARRQEGLRKAITTLEAFTELYEDWSALVDADHYFERAVRDTWHLSGGTGLAHNTSCRRVQVVHTNGRITQQEIIDDLGVEDGDEAAMRANLLAQGIKDVKRITVLPKSAAAAQTAAPIK
uniref:EF-hand domain-containing protein n=1 Tax=Neobodo designis TaxID=312471 RepID=A0A7S1QYL8_NEODS|mmetsp:Transcript_54772/g.168790  ORF Transcript_54772/g.168790 Transcript_54772/m.168790 type:complete len:488 (+) Transcript_54772:51-1514(+)